MFDLRMPTPEELRERHRPWAEMIEPLLLDKWSPELMALSIPTKFVEFPKHLMDPLFDPRDQFPQGIVELAAELDRHLGFENHFFRLNSRSPKDAPWPLVVPITCSGKQIIQVMAASERMMEDLYHFSHTDLQPMICLRKQEFSLQPEFELRCFLKDGRLLAVAEYGHQPIFAAPIGADPGLRKKVEQYVLGVVGPHLPRDTIVVDIWCKHDGFGLIEINPFGLSDPVGAISYEAIEAGIPGIARHPPKSVSLNTLEMAA